MLSWHRGRITLVKYRETMRIVAKIIFTSHDIIPGLVSDLAMKALHFTQLNVCRYSPFLLFFFWFFLSKYQQNVTNKMLPTVHSISARVFSSCKYHYNIQLYFDPTKCIQIARYCCQDYTIETRNPVVNLVLRNTRTLLN